MCGLLVCGLVGGVLLTFLTQTTSTEQAEAPRTAQSINDEQTMQTVESPLPENPGIEAATAPDSTQMTRAANDLAELSLANSAAPATIAPATTRPVVIRGEVHWPESDSRFRKLLADAMEALSKTPNDVAALRDAIDVAISLRERDTAFELLRRLIALEPDDAESQRNATTIAMQLGRWVDAIELLNTGIEQRPDDPVTRYNLAIAHQALGHLRDAERAWDAYLALRPDDGEARFQHGVTLLDLHEWTSAAEEFRAVLDATPSLQDAQLNLMLALSRSGDSTDVIAATDKFVAKNGDQTAILNRAAELIWASARKAGAPRQTLDRQVEHYCARSLAIETNQPEIRALQNEARQATK